MKDSKGFEYGPKGKKKKKKKMQIA